MGWSGVEPLIESRRRQIRRHPRAALEELRTDLEQAHAPRDRARLLDLVCAASASSSLPSSFGARSTCTDPAPSPEPSVVLAKPLRPYLDRRPPDPRPASPSSARVAPSLCWPPPSSAELPGPTSGTRRRSSRISSTPSPRTRSFCPPRSAPFRPVSSRGWAKPSSPRVSS